MKTLLIVACALALGCTVLAQGPVTPGGPPSPSMKTLQQLWERVGTLENQNQILSNAVHAQQQQIGILLENSDLILPWRIITVDSAGDVGLRSSLAFTRTSTVLAAT